MPTAMFSARIDADLKVELEHLARREDRSASYMANQAIRAFVEERRAVRHLVRTGLDLVDAGAAGTTPDAIHKWFLDEAPDPFPVAEERTDR